MDGRCNKVHHKTTENLFISHLLSPKDPGGDLDSWKRDRMDTVVVAGTD